MWSAPKLQSSQRTLLRTGPKLGLSPPSRTLPPSTVLAGAKRTGPKLGLSPPSRTLPLSAVLAGAKRTGPKLGLSPPSRTLPASATLAGVGPILMARPVSYLCIVMLSSLLRWTPTAQQMSVDSTRYDDASCNGGYASVGAPSNGT